MTRLAAALTAVAAALALGGVQFAAGTAAPPSWAQPEIAVVAAAGLLGGDAKSFRPDDPLTAGDLADLVAGLGGAASAPADPAAAVTMAQLDAGLVRGLGLGAAARAFTVGAREAGLAPPARFGTEVVARLLGLRVDHPPAQDSLELGPSDVATRAEAAYSAAKVLGWQGWEKRYVDNLAATFAPEPVTGWQRTILQTAISLIGYPYVYAGTSEYPQDRLGVTVPGGFDCSGFVWRLFKTASYAIGTSLPGTLRGRTTYAMSGEAPAAQRIGFDSLEPADVVFFGPLGPRSRPAQIGHMGVYLGGGWIVHSSTQGVSLSPIGSGYYRQRFAWARRPLAEAGLE